MSLNLLAIPPKTTATLSAQLAAALRAHITAHFADAHPAAFDGDLARLAEARDEAVHLDGHEAGVRSVEEYYALLKALASKFPDEVSSQERAEAAKGHAAEGAGRGGAAGLPSGHESRGCQGHAAGGAVRGGAAALPAAMRCRSTRPSQQRLTLPHADLAQINLAFSWTLSFPSSTSFFSSAPSPPSSPSLSSPARSSLAHAPGGFTYVAHPTLAYERAALLFSLAALHSQLACVETRRDTESCKRAVGAFAVSLAVF